MSVQELERQFSRIGTRAKIHPPLLGRATERISIDIRTDKIGEFFDISLDSKVIEDTCVLDVQPNLRHLLLMSSQSDGKHKFLCGHDERHWFVAAVPERAGVSTVKNAFDALKPVAVRARETQLHVKPRKRNRHRNEAFVRQGEWFFVPVVHSTLVDERWVLRNESLARGGGKPHMCEEIVRQGGTLVYISTQYPQGLLESERQKLFYRRPALKNIHWVPMRRNPEVYVRGRVKHPDHKTSSRRMARSSDEHRESIDCHAPRCIY